MGVFRVRLTHICIAVRFDAPDKSCTAETADFVWKTKNTFPFFFLFYQKVNKFIIAVLNFIYTSTLLSVGSIKAAAKMLLATIFHPNWSFYLKCFQNSSLIKVRFGFLLRFGQAEHKVWMYRRVLLKSFIRNVLFARANTWTF